MTADELNTDMLVAVGDMVRRTGAQTFQLRYSDDETPTVWIAVAGYDRGPFTTVYETAAGFSPDSASFRLLERLVDGGQCQHCEKPTGITDEIGTMPLGAAVCWYQYDPELKVFRRGCE